jgi:calcineurin-like phosphoesterase family protein
MPSVFLVSDTHFGHMGVCKFTRNDGVTKLRPYSTPEEMDEDMIEKWNARVKPTDKVYHLGDVVINRRALPTLARLNGDKVLIRGNHDIFPDVEYRQYFRELRAYHVMNGMILSHIRLSSSRSMAASAHQSSKSTPRARACQHTMRFGQSSSRSIQISISLLLTCFSSLLRCLTLSG